MKIAIRLLLALAPSSPGPRTSRSSKNGHRVHARQRPALHRAGAARGAGGLLPHLRERRLGGRPPRRDRHRPHVRAHGLQGHRHHRHPQLAPRRRRRSKPSSRPTTRSRPSATRACAPTRRRSTHLEAQPQGRHRRRPTAYVEPNAVPAHHRGERRRGAQRRHRRWTPPSTSTACPPTAWSCGSCWNPQRFLQPVFREFYKERDVVREEHRMRVESSPQGKLMEAFLATAFMAHPYRHMPGRLGQRHREPARARRPASSSRTYYVPVNITIGDRGRRESGRGATPGREVLRRRCRRGPPPPLLHTVEPPQEGRSSARGGIAASQPLLMIGYKRPDQYNKDDPVFDVISGILSSGRTGMLYKELVRDKQHRARGAGGRHASPAASTRTCSCSSWRPRSATRSRKTRRRSTRFWSA